MGRKARAGARGASVVGVGLSVLEELGAWEGRTLGLAGVWMGVDGVALPASLLSAAGDGLGADLAAAGLVLGALTLGLGPGARCFL